MVIYLLLRLTLLIDDAKLSRVIASIFIYLLTL